MAAPFFRLTPAVDLEIHLHSQLHDARVPCRDCLAVIGRSKLVRTAFQLVWLNTLEVSAEGRFPTQRHPNSKTPSSS